MPQMDTSCLYSTVKNTSGVPKFFGFLPPHGRTLAANQEFTVFGDIRHQVGTNQGGERSVQRRSLVAFENALNAGHLEIVNTPSPVLQDTVTNDPQMLQINDGTLAAQDPCWHNSVG